MSGQSGRRSRFKRRRFLRNREIFDAVGVACVCEEGLRPLVVTLRLECAPGGTRADLVRERREFWAADIAYYVPWCRMRCAMGVSSASQAIASCQRP